LERRSEPRIPSNQPVWLTVLSKNEVRCRAKTVEISSRGMKLMVAWRFPEDAVVRIEIVGEINDDALYLGEICYCRPEAGGFILGIEVHQVLTGLRDLARPRRRACEPLSEYVDAAS
jgi:PilZ domain